MDAYERLAAAIIIRAAKDWRAAKRKLKRKPTSREAAAEIRETEAFFLSPWFAVLTDLDGEMFLEKLKEEYR